MLILGIIFIVLNLFLSYQKTQMNLGRTAEYMMPIFWLLGLILIIFSFFN